MSDTLVVQLVDIHDTNQQEINDITASVARRLPKHTCPDIDKIISSIRAVERLCRNARKYESPNELASDIETEVFSLESMLEQLRTSNSSLRDIGDDWQMIAVANHERVHKLVSTLDITEVPCGEEVKTN